MYGAHPAGVYTKAMQRLADYLRKKEGNHYHFVVRASAGSVENVRDLQGRLAQIAVLQEDVAHHFEQGGHPLLKVAHLKNSPHIKSVCFLFGENFYVLAKPGKVTLASMRKINIGSMYGGGGVTALNLRQQLQYRWLFDRTSDPVTAMRKPDVDAVIVLSHSIKHVANELRKAGIVYHPVPLNTRERQAITASFPFYYEVTVPVVDSQGRTLKVPTIATRALLAVQRDLPIRLVRLILNLFTDKESFRKFAKALPEVKSLHGSPFMDPKSSYNMRFARFPIPIHPAVFELHWGKHPYQNFFFFGVPFFLVLLCIVILHRHRQCQRWLRGHTRWGETALAVFEKYWLDAFLATSLVLYVIVITNWIKYLEIQAFLNNEVMSPSHFVYMGFKELFTWLFVFIATGYEDAIFPKTMLAKILASSIRIVIISSVVYVLGRISADFITTLIKGREMTKTYNLKDHIVICNWNQKGNKIVEELHSTLLQENDMARPVIIISEQSVSFPDSPAFEDTYCIPGDPASGWKLRNANVPSAFAVIILSKEDEPEKADTHTIMISMEIAELLDEAEVGGRRKQRPHIAAEIIDGKNARYLRRAGVNEVISGNELGVKLLAQTAVTPGVSAFMDNLLTYTAESNEIYIVAPPSELIEHHASFDEIVKYLLSNRDNCEYALLVGIQRGTPPVMMVNPGDFSFSGLEMGDKLVIIARKRPIFV